MKTTCTLLLAIAIHAMVKGQTPANQAFETNKHFVLGYANYTEAERREFSRVEDPTELNLRAEDLRNRSAQLKKVALRRSPEERERLNRETSELDHKADLCQLAAAELAAYNTREEFNLSRVNYKAILENTEQGQPGTVKAATLYAMAVKSYRMATEMREEAYALPSISATLGNLHNAEEREFIALIKINEAIQILRQSPAPAVVVR